MRKLTGHLSPLFCRQRKLGLLSQKIFWKRYVFEKAWWNKVKIYGVSRKRCWRVSGKERVSCERRQIKHGIMAFNSKCNFGIQFFHFLITFIVELPIILFLLLPVFSLFSLLVGTNHDTTRRPFRRARVSKLLLGRNKYIGYLCFFAQYW